MLIGFMITWLFIGWFVCVIGWYRTFRTFDMNTYKDAVFIATCIKYGKGKGADYILRLYDMMYYTHFGQILTIITCILTIITGIITWPGVLYRLICK